MCDPVRKSCLPPIVPCDARILILGSLPGDASLAAREYYAHPRNQFWRLMGKVLNMDLGSLGYPLRLKHLADARIGLWDVIASARRRGSLDSGICDHRLQDIASMCAALPELRVIAFNGAKASALGRNLAGIERYPQLPLPSSSPANTRAFESKWTYWRHLRDFL